MSNLPPQPGGEKPKITSGRIAIWVIVAGIGLYLIITGVVGIIAGSFLQRVFRGWQRRAL